MSATAQISSPLLQRLTDLAPGEVHQNDNARYINYQTLRQDIRQHLEQILNTRLNFFDTFSEDNACSRSILTYGISDFSGQYYSIKKHQHVLCQQIERTLSHFEPRLQQISVQLIDHDDVLNRQFRFRINGVVHLKPEPVQTTFESDLDIVRYQFSLEENG